MAVLNQGETIVCSVEVRDENNVLKDPVTSMKVRISDPSTAEVVAETAMTKDSTGKYHYDYQCAANALLGTYKVIFTATDGLRITINKETFNVK